MIKKLKFVFLIMVSSSLLFLSCKNKVPVASQQMVLPVEVTSSMNGSYVMLNINGYMYAFLLDLGLEKNYIDEHTAYVINNYKKQKDKTFRINSLNWGAYTFNNIDFVINNTLSLDSFYAGILGQDFFKSFDFLTLDLSTNRLILNENISSKNFIKYRLNNYTVSFKQKNINMGLVTLTLPNMYSDSLQSFPETDLDVNISNPIPYSQSELYTLFPDYFKGKDALLGFDALMENTVSFDLKNKKFAFNKSNNTESLPYRNPGEKMSFSESIKKSDINLPETIEIPLQIKNNGMYINIPFDDKELSFMLDTGAPYNNLFKDGLYKTHIKTNDNEHLFKIYTSSFIINDTKMNEIELTLYDAKVGLKNDGLLGMVFLTSYPEYTYVQINYPEKVLRFTNKKPSGQEVPIESKNHLYCNVEVNGKIYKALIDSGCINDSVIVDCSDSELFPEQKSQATSSLYNRITNSFPYTKDLPVTIGNKKIQIPCYNASEEFVNSALPDILTWDNVGKVSMVLGIDLFTKNIITFDFKNSLMWIE